MGELARPLTAVVLAGSRRGGLVTFSSDDLQRGVKLARVAEPVATYQPGAVVNPMGLAPIVEHYDVHRCAMRIGEGWHVEMFVLVQSGTPVPWLVPMDVAVSLIMAWRGWLGPDEGERWIVRHEREARSS